MKTIERKQIKGHPNFEIDTNGKVWNTTTRQSLREYVNPAGFSYVVLDRKIRTIAYLMKAAFFADNNLCIRHRDGDRTNNKLSNLYTWFDGSETLNPDGSEKKVIVMECDPQTNEVIRFWNSLKEAADNVGVTTDRIKRGQIVKGRKFDYYNAGIDGVGLFDYTDGNHIIQIYNEGGHLIGEATKLAEASEISGESITTVKNCLATDQPSLRKKYRYIRRLSTTLADDDVEFDDYDEDDEEEPKKRARGVEQYDKKGKLIAHHKTVREASEATGINDPNIRQCLNGVTTHAGGYVWRWEGEPFYKYSVTVSRPQPNEPKPKVKRDPRTYKRDTVSTVGKRLCQYDKDGNLINTWDNATQAAKTLNINLAQLGRAAKGKVKTAGGYYWAYEGEPFNKYSRTATQQSVKRPLYQMKPAEDGNGFIIINEWDGVREAAKELGFPVASLAAVASKRSNKPYKDGYYYSYATF